MKIFITGATGFVGKNVIEQLGDGKEIYALVRNVGNNPFGENINCIEGDLFNLQNAYNLQDIDVVIQIAGITKSLYCHNYFKINSRGTFEVIKLAKAKNVKQFVLISSLAAAGPSPSHIPVDEDSPAKPVSLYGLSKLLGEKYLKDSGLTYTVIRPPAIFGPHDRDIFTYFKMVNSGITFSAGDKKKLYSLIYVKDLAEFIGTTLLNINAFNETFFISYDSLLTISDILSFIKEALDKKAVNINLPEFFTKIIYFPMQLFYIVSGNPPLLNRDKLNEITQKFWICSSKKASEKLNFKPKYSLVEAFRETANWYIEKKWL